MLALVDCNNFYASCERVFHPKRVGRPLVVLSNNDGCVIARSNEAKALGITMGAPFFSCKDLFKMHDVIVCSSNFSLYGDMSERVMKTLRQFSPEIQIYSIDEAFMQLNEGDSWEYGQKIRNTVFKWTGIPVSIGIAKTKTLAKIASHKAKKDLKQGGVYILDSKEEIDLELDATPVNEIWGIGTKSGLKLNRLGIVSAKDFRDADDTVIKKHLTILGVRTAWELRGIPALSFEEIPPSKKSITCSRAFGHPIDNLEQLNEAIASYTARAAEKIRKQKTLTTSMIVLIERHPFNKDFPGHLHLRITLPEPTDYTPHLITEAKKAVKTLFQKGLSYRKAGIILDGLIPNHIYQGDLFAPPGANTEKQQRVMEIMDKMNVQLGKNAIHSAAEGLNNTWKMKQEHGLQKFTTSWDELLKIKI